MADRYLTLCSQMKTGLSSFVDSRAFIHGLAWSHQLKLKPRQD
jgi:hypothetical protein